MKFHSKHFFCLFTLGFLTPAPLPAATTIPWTDSHIQYSGRFDNSHTGYTQLGYSASSITASFTGTSITASLSGPYQYFRVILDGQIQSNLVEISPAQQSYTLATGLVSGTHTVTLVKLNEPNLSTSGSGTQTVVTVNGTSPVNFYSLQLDAGQSLVSPPALPSNRIEVIGDSVTCGYGNLAPSGASGYQLAQEDGYYAYGACAARLLGAEYHAVAWSGGYLYPVTNLVNLPALYTKALPQNSTAWNFANWIPQVVVINLGTNDFGYWYSQPGGLPFTGAQWVTAYTNFIATIRANYGTSTIIYCMVGPMLSSGGALTDWETYAKQVVSTMNASGDANVRYFEVPPEGNNRGADYHPNKAEDIIVSGSLAAQIHTDLGWTVGTTAAIATQPASCAVSVGQPASFTVVASGTPPFSYQWLKSGVNIPGATSSTYSIASVALTDAGGYSVAVSNTIGSGTSNSATLTVNQASQTISFPSIANQQYPGPQVSLNAVATSGLPVTYSVVSGPASVSGSTLTISGTGTVTVQASQAGNTSYLPAASVNQSFIVVAALSFTQWEGQSGFFTPSQLAIPAISGLTSIPENDGIPNLLKYLYDINPAVPMSATNRVALPTLGTITTGGTTYLTLTYRQYGGLTGVTINLQTSSDLNTWTTVNPLDFSQQVGTDSTTGDPIMEIGVKTNGSARQFIRLNVTQP